MTFTKSDIKRGSKMSRSKHHEILLNIQQNNRVKQHKAHTKLREMADGILHKRQKEVVGLAHCLSMARDEQYKPYSLFSGSRNSVNHLMEATNLNSLIQNKTRKGKIKYSQLTLR